MITIEKRDLFTVSQGYYLAHCISADFTLGAGIAKKFDEVYNMRFKLFRDYDQEVDDCKEFVGEALLIDNVFNLVTKVRYFHKPTYDTLRDSLKSMKAQCEDMAVTKVAMPKIGCGLDRLDWNQVYEMIEEIFEDSNVDILICEV